MTGDLKLIIKKGNFYYNDKIINRSNLNKKIIFLLRRPATQEAAKAKSSWILIITPQFGSKNGLNLNVMIKKITH